VPLTPQPTAIISGVIGRLAKPTRASASEKTSRTPPSAVVVARHAEPRDRAACWHAPCNVGAGSCSKEKPMPPRGVKSRKRSRQYKKVLTSIKREGRYRGRQKEVAARIVNKTRRRKGETRSRRRRRGGGQRKAA
jgi:hypothetical protein